MKIGIILTAYNCAEGIEDRLKTFQRPGFIISAISAPFIDFPTESGENDKTCEILSILHRQDKIRHLITSSIPLTEVEARNNALAPLLEIDGCDYVWIVDGSDEYYENKDIDYILKFIEERGCCWYSIFFKNYVFDEKTWIDGFCPPRIYRNLYQNLKFGAFYGDNCVFYLDEKGNKIDYKTLSTNPVFKFKVQVKHLSWSNPKISKQKVKYQNARNWLCSYRWNEEKDCLEFNPEYYKNKPLPELNYEV